MKTANDKLIYSVLAVIKWQLTILSLLLVAFFIYAMVVEQAFWGKPLVSMLYGSVLAILTTLISASSARKVGDAAYSNSPSAMASVYWGALNKLVLVAVGISLALIKFELAPYMMFIGFLFMHVAQVIVGLKQKTF